MGLLVWIATILLVLGVGGVAVLKLSNHEEAITQANRLGYEHIRRLTGFAELFGVAGVVIGAVSSDLEWLGILAAIGIAGMMLGAIVYHRRAGDTWPTLPSIVMLVFSAIGSSAGSSPAGSSPAGAGAQFVAPIINMSAISPNTNIFSDLR